MRERHRKVMAILANNHHAGVVDDGFTPRISSTAGWVTAAATTLALGLGVAVPLSPLAAGMVVSASVAACAAIGVGIRKKQSIKETILHGRAAAITGVGAAAAAITGGEVVYSAITTAWLPEFATQAVSATVYAMSGTAGVLAASLSQSVALAAAGTINYGAAYIKNHVELHKKEQEKKKEIALRPIQQAQMVESRIAIENVTKLPKEMTDLIMPYLGESLVSDVSRNKAIATIVRENNMPLTEKQDAARQRRTGGGDNEPERVVFHYLDDSPPAASQRTPDVVIDVRDDERKEPDPRTLGREFFGDSPRHHIQPSVSSSYAEMVRSQSLRKDIERGAQQIER